MDNEIITELAATIGQRLTQHALRLCAAESCTGGLLLSHLTDVPGSSAYVLGGIVTYSNMAKQQFVGVQEATLIAHGAVSPQTASEMALGVRRAFAADIGVGITGIAGPSGGTPEKPVGLVYIGMAADAVPDGVQVQRYVWPHDRAGNKRASVGAALQMILDAYGG